MTNAELSALPERKEYELVTRADGLTERVSVPIKFRRYEPSPNDVFMFHDKDGSWFVDYHLEGGPYKRRVTF